MPPVEPKSLCRRFRRSYNFRDVRVAIERFHITPIKMLALSVPKQIGLDTLVAYMHQHRSSMGKVVGARWTEAKRT